MFVTVEGSWPIANSINQESEVGGGADWEIVSFRLVRACLRAGARSGCLVEFEPKSRDLPFPFSLMPCRAFPFPSPHTQISYPILAGLLGVTSILLAVLKLCNTIKNELPDIL